MNNRSYNRINFDSLYQTAPPVSARGESRRKWVRQHFPGNAGSVLDVGSGIGKIGKELIEAGYDVTAVDISFNSLKLNPSRRVCSEVTSLPFAASSFDAALCCDVLEHLNEEERQATVRELIRVSNAYVLVTVPNSEYLPAHQTRCDRCKSWFHTWGHLRAFDETDLSEEFGKYPGLDLVDLAYSEWQERRERIWFSWIRRYLLRCPVFDEHLICPACLNDQVRPCTDGLINRIMNRLGSHFSVQRPAWLLALYRRV